MAPQTRSNPVMKRKAEVTADDRSVRQRTSLTSKALSRTPPYKPKTEEVSVVDLVEIEDEEQYEELKAKEQAAAIKQQQQEQANRPVKLAEFECIICMEKPTDLTVTHCGMLSWLRPLVRHLLTMTKVISSALSVSTRQSMPEMEVIQRKLARSAERRSVRQELRRERAIRRNNLGTVSLRWR